MNKFFLLLLSVIFFTGCASIDKNLLLDKGTKVEIIDVSKDPIISSDVTNDYGSLSRRIMGYTKDELGKLNIEASTYKIYGAAKLKYDIKNFSKGIFKYTVKYKVTLETTDGKIIFIDNEDKDDSDIDVIFERMANRTAKFVSKSFK